MFIGNMVTEAIPARVYALYRIVVAKKGIVRSELQGLMEPSGIYEGSDPYFPKILTAAKELKLVDIQDKTIYPLESNDKIDSIEDMRKHAISKLGSFEGEQFYKCTNAIVNLNEEIFKFKSVSENDMLNYLTEKTGQKITAPMALGWRFWAQFLGFGYVNGVSFLPNAYVFVKNLIKLMELEKNKEYQIDEFMALFNQYGRILTDNTLYEKHFNLALSSALRELHENSEITLKYISDQASQWILFPSNDLFNNPVSAIVYKGVKR